MDKSGSFIQNLSKGVQSRIKKTMHNPYSKVNVNWMTLKYLKHLPANQLHSHELLRGKTWFYGGPEYLHGLKEIFLEEVYKQTLPENAEILDCGAHIGLSVIYLKSLCPTAHIRAFEPDPRNFSLLKKNIESRKYVSVELINEAVWTENTALQFVADGNMGSKIDLGGVVKTNTVKASRLRDYLDREINFLKLDIEGAEYAVLKDVSDKLHLVNNMFLEYHGTFEQNNELLDIFGMIHQAGFHYYIKEAASIYAHPFVADRLGTDYDVQLNIFCFRKQGLPG